MFCKGLKILQGFFIFSTYLLLYILLLLQIISKITMGFKIVKDGILFSSHGGA